MTNDCKSVKINPLIISEDIISIISNMGTDSIYSRKEKDKTFVNILILLSENSVNLCIILCDLCRNLCKTFR